MAVTVTSQPLDINALLVSTASLTATLEADVTGGAGLLYTVQLVNTDGSNDAFFLAYDSGDATVGTTAVDWCLYAPANDTVTYTITDGTGAVGGVAFTNLSIAAVKNVGVNDGPGGSGSTNPTSAVKAYLVCKAT